MAHLIQVLGLKGYRQFEEGSGRYQRPNGAAHRFDQPPMYEHPLYHPPAGKTAIWDNTIHFAGTETASQHGGYLEGALGAAERAVMNSIR
jgi:monoamine oxidase